MANKRYMNRDADQKYDGEQGVAGMGEMQSSSGTARDNTGPFAPREQVNNMKGTGAATPDQASYTVPRDNWRGK